MNHLFTFLFVLQVLITSTVSIAMELEIPQNKNYKKAKILTKITDLEKPRDACYLTNNSIIIKEEKQYSIANITTDNTKNKKTYDDDEYPSHIAVHPNKTKFALAFCNRLPHRISIYNAETYNCERTIRWDSGHIGSICFNPHKDSLAIGDDNHGNITLWHYIPYHTHTNIIKISEVQHEYHKGNKNHSPIFSFHPTQPLICLAWETIYTYDLKKTTEKTKAATTLQNYQQFCEYSPDGSYIATSSFNTINIIQPNSEQPDKTIWKKWENKQYPFYRIAMYPHDNILVTLFHPESCNIDTYHDIIKYWDISTGKCITEQELPCKTHNLKSRLSVSPCGTKFLIIANDELLEVAIPYEVIYHNTILFYALFALKNVNLNGETIEIPNDITRYITHKLLKTYKKKTK